MGSLPLQQSKIGWLCSRISLTSSVVAPRATTPITREQTGFRPPGRLPFTFDSKKNTFLNKSRRSPSRATRVSHRSAKSDFYFSTSCSPPSASVFSLPRTAVCRVLATSSSATRSPKTSKSTDCLTASSTAYYSALRPFLSASHQMKRATTPSLACAVSNESKDSFWSQSVSRPLDAKSFSAKKCSSLLFLIFELGCFL